MPASKDEENITKKMKIQEQEDVQLMVLSPKFYEKFYKNCSHPEKMGILSVNGIPKAVIAAEEAEIAIHGRNYNRRDLSGKLTEFL